MLRLVLSTSLTLLATLASAAVPGDRWWGVIVGVSHYERGEDLELLGPRNDVPLILSWLGRQQVPRDHLTVLADQVPKVDGVPTRSAILRALAALPNRMKSGDIAFLYFAGHGSQQPEGGREWHKYDGQDEIFLPRDVGRWNESTGGIDGAILDSEVGRAVDALRARGVFVWLVFDSCHSATMARASALPGLRLRAVAPSRLGVPPSPRATASALGASNRPPIHVADRMLAGGYVAFYAAQTLDSAPEMNLPSGDPERKPHGLFTYALLEALSATSAGSYREVSHRILAVYATTYPGTTPEFEGALDDAIGAPGMPLVSAGAWPAQRLNTEFHVNAGRLNGVTPGSMLELSTAIRGKDDAGPLGLLRVNRATLTDAWATVVTRPAELARWKVSEDRTESVSAGVVNVLETAWDLTVRISGPATCFPQLTGLMSCEPAARPAETGTLELARRLTTAAGGLPEGVVRSADPEAADLLLLLEGHRLYLLRPASVPPHIEWAAAVDLSARDAEQQLHDALFRAVRAVGLLRLAEDFPGRPDGLMAEIRSPAVGGRPSQMVSNRGAAIQVGDGLLVRLQNKGTVDLDVSVLAIDDHFGITPVFPVDRETNLLRRGSAAIEIPVWVRTPGRQQLLFITEESRAGRPHDLSYLAQPGVTRQAGGHTGFPALLERVGFSTPGSRAGVSPGDRRTSAIRIVSYEVGDRT